MSEAPEEAAPPSSPATPAEPAASKTGPSLVATLLGADLPVIALAVALLAIGWIVRARSERLGTFNADGVHFLYPHGWLQSELAAAADHRMVELTEALGGDRTSYKPRVFVSMRKDPPAAYAAYLAANLEVDEEQSHKLYKSLGQILDPLGLDVVPGANGAGIASVRLDFAFALKPTPDDLPAVVETREIGIIRCPTATSCDRLWVIGVSAPLEDWGKHDSLYERILSSVALGSPPEVKD